MKRLTAIGVDIGGTNIRAGRIEENGKILHWLSEPTPLETLEIVPLIATLVEALDNSDVSCIGIGVPGRVDTKKERVLSGGFVDLAGHSLAATLRKQFGKPAFVDNDGNMALAAEHAIGAAAGCRDVVMFTIGTGIGGGIISDGKILRGRAAAGQLGHLTIDLSGEPCLCGRRGCIETTSSGTALRRHLQVAGLELDCTIQTVLSRAENSDRAARSVLACWAGPMRAAVDTIVAAIDPELVLLGGGLGSAMHQALAQFPAEAQWYNCPVKPAQLGDHAGVIGAALSAIAQGGELS